MAEETWNVFYVMWVGLKILNKRLVKAYTYSYVVHRVALIPPICEVARDDIQIGGIIFCR